MHVIKNIKIHNPIGNKFYLSNTPSGTLVNVFKNVNMQVQCFSKSSCHTCKKEPRII